MQISLQDISPVDKEVIITANRKDLQPKFEEAYKNYKKQIALPGFRPGKVPVNIIQQRFGNEIEQEEISSYVQEVFEKEIIPEYEPVGEPEMTDLSWENDELEAKFKIGTRPEFELANLENIKVDLMVHDVTDEEVREELDHQLEQEGNWEEVDDSITETSRVTANATLLDNEGKPVEGETDENQVIDLNKKEYAAFKDDLLGKKTGDVTTVDIDEDDEESTRFKLLIKKVEKLHPAKLTDAFAKKQSKEEAKNVDEYKSLIKSRIQDYYDQTSQNLFENDVTDKLVGNHEFEVPEQFIVQVQNQYQQRLLQQYGGQLPDDFDWDAYKEDTEDQASKDAKWFFINEKLQEKFDDIEIEAEDVDEHLTAQAAQYGATLDQMRSVYTENPEQLEQLRNTIRQEKVFKKLRDVVEINELNKEDYQKEHAHNHEHDHDHNHDHDEEDSQS